MAFGEVHDANRNAFSNLQRVTEPDAFGLERGQDPHFAEPAAHIEDVNLFRYAVDDQPHGLACFACQYEIGHTSSSTISNFR